MEKEITARGFNLSRMKTTPAIKATAAYGFKVDLFVRCNAQKRYNMQLEDALIFDLLQMINSSKD